MPTRVIPPRHPKAANFVDHYFQPGFESPITSNEGLQDLIDKVRQFRIDNDLDVGDPAGDVAAYHRSIDGRFKNRRPRGIRRSGGMPSEVDMVLTPEKRERLRRPESRTLIDKVRTWIKLAKQRKWPDEPKEVIKERADICAACPKNRSLETATLCKPCIQAVERDEIVLTFNRGDQRLGVCEVVHQANQVAVMMPKEELGRSLLFVEETPDFCWLRSLVPEPVSPKPEPALIGMTEYTFTRGQVESLKALLTASNNDVDAAIAAFSTTGNFSADELFHHWTPMAERLVDKTVDAYLESISLNSVVSIPHE